MSDRPSANSIRMPQGPLPIATQEAPLAAPSEETLVRDARAGVRPAEQVDCKLVGMLKQAPVPVSQMRSRDCSRVRTHC